MQENTIKVLEFDKLKDILSQYTTSNLGKLRVDALVPMTDMAEIKRQLDVCSEAKEIYLTTDGFPLGGLKDIRYLLKKVSKPGAMLDPKELLDIVGVARAARNVKSAMAKREKRFTHIRQLVANLPTLPELEAVIEASINPEGEIIDEASPELRRIRRQLTRTREIIHDKLEATIRSPQYQKHIQEQVITQRNDRYVIPVKQDSSDVFPGVVQSRSSSGATTFLEPLAVVKHNNSLHRLATEELQEIRRILLALSNDVRDYLSELTTALEILGELDFLGAKARLSIEFRCIKPTLNNRGYFNLIHARHPLLELSLKEKPASRESGEKSAASEVLRPNFVVPTDIYIGDGFNVLVITGPNTGGKTVALKTVGLLTLMVQSGLHIPAGDGSELAVFEHVFADIGDEQSIQQNLSTFSSHMTKIIEIVNKADAHSLVLLDEIGAGTDPTEGAALGMAILDHFNKVDSRIIVTTHYGIIKAHAHSHQGMENASMEFDWRTLEPTYRLRIGVPGGSNAIKIAEHLGMPEYIRQAAQEYIGSEAVAIEELILSMENERHKLEDERKVTREKELELTQIQREYEELLHELKAERGQLREAAEQESAEIVRNTRKLIENTVAEIRKEQASRESIRQAHATVDKLREDLHKSQKTHEPSIQLKKTIQIGDKVRIKSLKRFGEVVQPPDARGMIQVQIGNMTASVPLNDIQRTTATYNKPKLSPSVLELQYAKRGKVSHSLNLRGQIVQEALDELDKYLDDVLLAGLEEVIIIHGKGTGALSNAVKQYLREHPQIANFREGDHTEGGEGVTVAILKG